ncbi:MAG: PIN domain-containing protein [Opitutaceae bacterium]|nr:PIN domain-containing protein [Opitutaceae bacterium]
MAASVVLDAGPLVALIDRNDPHHAWAHAQADILIEPIVTCEAVWSEAAFLLDGIDPGFHRLNGFMRDGIVRFDFNLNANFDAVAAHMAKYHDVPMSLADACLVRMSELHDRARVFTLDSDFRRYRRHGRQTIPLIIPAS